MLRPCSGCARKPRKLPLCSRKIYSNEHFIVIEENGDISTQNSAGLILCLMALQIYFNATFTAVESEHFLERSAICMGLSVPPILCEIFLGNLIYCLPILLNLLPSFPGAGHCCRCCRVFQASEVASSQLARWRASLAITPSQKTREDICSRH